MPPAPVLPRLAQWAAGTGCAAPLAATADGGADAQRPELLLTAMDHHVAAPDGGRRSPLSALPWGHAAGEAERLSTGESPLYTLAHDAGVDVTVTMTDEGVVDAPVSGWVARGTEAADLRADAATPLILTGGLGTGATATAAALIGVLCNVEPVKVVGRGGAPTPIDDETWKNKTVAIRDLMFRARSHRRRPLTAASAGEILDTVGSADIAFTTGLLAQCGTRRTPVIVDGVTGLAAGLLAEAITPGASRWWLVPDVSTEPAAGPARRRLSLSPVVDQPLGAPGAASGLLILPLLRTAAALAERH